MGSLYVLIKGRNSRIRPGSKSGRTVGLSCSPGLIRQQRRAIESERRPDGGESERRGEEPCNARAFHNGLCDLRQRALNTTKHKI
jgi:hypothetical protein